MIFEIDRASHRNTGKKGVPPCDGSYLGEVVHYPRANGTTHDEALWVIEINTLDELIDLGQIVLGESRLLTGRPSILIYDDYIE